MHSPPKLLGLAQENDEMSDQQTTEPASVSDSPATLIARLGAQRPINRSSVRKQRASVACNHCRFRKVKCTVLRGNTCYNCVLEQVECILPQPRPRGKPKAQRPSATTQPKVLLAHSPTVSSPSVRPRPPLEPAITEQDPWFPPDRHPNEDMSRSPCAIQPRPLCDPLSGDSSLESSNVHETVAPDRNFDWYGAATQSLTSPISPEDSAAPLTKPVLSATSAPALQDSDLPPFVQPISADLAAEDLLFLRRKGALSLPDAELRNDLLRNYMELVHHCLPVIDLDSVQASLKDPVRHGRISLLLLQAMMFSATALADVKLVRRAGFLTRDAMRRAYYHKTKLLYDFNCERDRIAIVQTLVLLTTWWVTPTEQKDGYYWCSVALTVAKSIGLHRDVHNEGLSLPVRRLRRRIWFCCLARDAITSLGCNRAPRIRSHDFTMAPLTLDDTQGSDSASLAHQNRPSQAQVKLASIWIASTKLCRILSTIVDLFYAENPIGHIGVLYPKQDNVREPKSTRSPPIEDFQKLETCEQELQRWRDQVPDDLLHQSPIPVVTSSAEEAVVIHRAFLAMLYRVAQFCLHRPRALADRMGLGAGHDQMQASQKSMRTAAENLNKIVMDLYQVDLMRRVPGTVISCILTVSWSHVFDLQSPSDARRREGARRFEECKLALRELVDANVAAEWAIAFLTFAASHVTRLFKRQRVLSVQPDATVTGSAPGPVQHLPTSVTSNVQDNESSVRDWTNINAIEMYTRQGSGVGLSNYEDSALGTVLNLPEDEFFNLDFSNMTDMWVGMPTVDWDLSTNSPGL